MENVRLSRSDLPELYRIASATSAIGQGRVVRLTSLLLGAGLMSGIFALFGGKDGWPWHAWADLMSAVFFAVAAVGGALLNSGKAHRRWYDGRAAAESMKTLSWKYVMRAAPLVDDATADEHFVERLAEIRTVMVQLSESDPALLDADEAITPLMQRLREAPVAVKREVYRDVRIRGQIEWYAAKAADAEHRAQAWRALTVILGVAGFTGALLRAAGVSDIDALGLAAAFLASIAAWTELRQYWVNAAAYELTLRELRAIEAESSGIADDDGMWGSFCEHAEYAISREHTMWRARAR